MQPNRRSPYEEYDRVRGSQDQLPLSNLNPGYVEEPVHYGPAHPAYEDSGAGAIGAIGLERRDSDASSYHSDHGPNVRQRWGKTEPQRDTAILLEKLPSKQFERMAGEVGKTPSRKASRREQNAIERLQDEENDPEEIDEQLKSMTMTLSKKRKLKKELSLKRKKQPSQFKRLKYSFAISWRHFKYKMAEFGYFLKLWRGHIKMINGHFGTGVLSYFLFLKWIFFINMPTFFLTFCFVILPQILHRWFVQTPKGYTQNVTFTGQEFLTGAKWFTDTEMYYGYYTDQAFSLVEHTTYNMKYAYLFTCGGYYILCLVILALSISRSYKKNYIEGSGAFNFYNVSRVFCGWDYGITAQDAASLKHKSIRNELQEYLSGIKEEEDKATFGEKFVWFLIRLFININVLGMIGGSGYLIYYISTTQSVQVTIPILSELAMPLCVSGINLIIPLIFTFLGRLEKYKKPRTELYIGMSRIMLLKAAVLGVLVYFWYEKLGDEVKCKETFIGQEIYRLVVVDFIFTLLTTFFVEFGRKQLSNCCSNYIEPPEFSIGRNTLNLIYSQALCWLGSYFCPMLSLVMIVKLFILFYVKRISVINNCKPSLRPWRAARSHTIFLAFLFCFFLMATAAVACAIIFVPPSKECGPFTNYTTSYQVVVELVDGLNTEYPVLHTIIEVISSSGFIAGLIVVLCVLTYYMRIVMVGHREMVNLLRQQLSMEGRDKAYLLNMLQNASKKKNKQRSTGPGTPGATSSRLLSPGAVGTLDSTSPGGRQFIKSVASTIEKTPEPQRRKRHNDGLRTKSPP